MKTTLACTLTLCGAAAFAAPGQDGLNRDYWTGVSTSSVAQAQKVIATKAPSGSDVIKTSEAVSWKDGKRTSDFADQYVQKMYGFIVPDKTGEYIFFVAADDTSEVRLSPGEQPTDAKAICKTTSWTPARKFDMRKEQKSDKIKLEAGKKYYIEGVMQEGGGGDNFAIAWLIPGGAKPELITAKNLKTAK